MVRNYRLYRKKVRNEKQQFLEKIKIKIPESVYFGR